MEKFRQIRGFTFNAMVNILSPNQDKRRNIEYLDQRIIRARFEYNQGNPSEVNEPEISDFSDAQISLIYNDCVSHIKALQQQHWKIFTWSAAVVTAIAGFAISKPAILGSLLGIIGILCMLAFAGGVGIYFMNEESVMLERNRNHLDAIRACMHRVVQDIYLDRDVANDRSDRRISMKRESEIVMHAIIGAWSIALMMFLILYTIVSPTSLP